MLICCKIWIMHVKVDMKEQNVIVHEKLGVMGTLITMRIHCLLLESIYDQSYHFIV
jgi:hypothetical protein